MNKTHKIYKYEYNNMQIFDEDSANDVFFEEQKYRKWFQAEHNRIMAMRPGKRKQQAYSDLYGKKSSEQEFTNEELKELESFLW